MDTLNKLPPRSEFLNEKELSALWGISVSTLQHWRCGVDGNTGPRFYKIGCRVLYHKDDILRYARERFYVSTGEKVLANGGDGDDAE